MATAFYFLDSAHPGGAVIPVGDGWDWYLIAAVRDAPSGHKAVVGVQAHSLDGDSLVQVRDKHIAAVKAAALAQDGSVVQNVVFPAMTLLTGV